MAKEIYLILHNIRSMYNVGAIFRTAEAVGVKKIYLTGYTPTPVDKFGVIRKEIHKTALGAEEMVKWEKERDIKKLIEKLKSEKIEVVAVEQDGRAIDYRKFKQKRKIAFILGNEVRGLDKRILRQCDKIIFIPMFGKKESLNVSVAAGIVLYGVVKI